MKKKNNKILMVSILILGLNIAIVNNVSAIDEPTLDIDPEKPTPKSTITCTATVEDQNVIEVWLEIQECDINTGICFTKQNLTMDLVDTNTYETAVTLEHAEATYIQYSLIVRNDIGWNTYLKNTKVNLSEKQNGEDGKNGNDDNGTPGFELFSVFISLMLMMFIYIKRKR
jgi:hypothetical protein